MIDDDERTNAVGLFNTARSYWRSAEHLNAANVKVTHPQAPVTFLFCHAIELYLKAYLRGAGKTVADLKKVGHRVTNLAKLAMTSGLVVEPEQSEILSHIDDAEVAIESRYIVTGFTTRPANEALANVAETLDQRVCAALMEFGLQVRREAFDRPPAQSQNEFDRDTIRVLVYLFGAEGDDARGERAIASALGLQRAMVRYHLERLADAHFAVVGSSWNNDNYWSLRSEGRRYVVQQKLVSGST
jgi:hypothetical protein